jgi:hypothetical protein
MSGLTTCPRCRADVSHVHITERGLICPHCQNPLAGTGLGGLAAPEVDTDVRRGVGPVGITLAILIVANVVGIGAAYVPLLARPNTADAIGSLLWMLFLFALLDLLVIIAVMRPLARWWLKGRPIETYARYLGLLLLGFLVTLAVVIVFFTACVGLIRLIDVRASLQPSPPSPSADLDERHHHLPTLPP